jgi:hypothetical protein
MIPIFIMLAMLFTTAAGLTAGFFAFATMKRDLRKQEEALDEIREKAEADLAATKKKLGEWSAELQESREQTRQSSAAPDLSSRLSVNKRGQVLRLHRRGENPNQICASLGLSRGEVELILKVQTIFLSNYQGGQA